MRAVLLALAVSACTPALPPGMERSITVYDDVEALYARCGAGACVATDGETYCDMHLPAAANGDYIMSAYWHEYMHCAGQGHRPESYGDR